LIGREPLPPFSVGQRDVAIAVCLVFGSHTAYRSAGGGSDTVPA
jgi:hypothetical protein